ncbi:MAG TPA: type II toxin-antitoxin system RelE/ParE family toxin [Candidatus Monoglobus merdigallinarum]|uniref:Type II toxin-antitoxin system RelE/ParE family toxin n=1 Tax=Candidatus Monoglobus merdigallinarum TaxID=2838698 RepID=A0A9D1PS85_9FIRM|nr:type II toxin-antitoxin system RelE/ParE family toxin [Candidatus Monoglobus merdigallinarum]
MYHIVIKKKAKKFIDKLSAEEKRRVVAEIERLPRGGDIKPLRGYQGLLRLRVGKYRIIYTVDNGKLTVIVIDAENRGQVYKHL